MHRSFVLAVGVLGDIRDENLSRIHLHNSDPQKTFTLSPHSKFLNRSWAEFQSTILMAPQECSATTMPGRQSVRAAGFSLPASVDWRTKGMVSEVKDQGDCGSCYSFSSTGALESHHLIKYGRSKKSAALSEQQVLDCSSDFDNHGCDGGLPSHVFEYVHHQGGIDSETAYPYEQMEGQCRYVNSGVAARTQRSFNVTENDEESLVAILATVGPVSVAYEVVDDFMHYQSGIYSSDTCRKGTQDVNHAVLIVGYGFDAQAGPFWIVKNSWGSDWGEDGYFRIVRGKNMCGIAVCASYPILADDEGDGRLPFQTLIQ